MRADPESLKSFLETKRKEIAISHRGGAGSFETCTALTSMMDEVMQSALATLPEESQRHIAILALGGYGRGELFPGSDTDVMVLCASGEVLGGAGEAAKKFLHLLWDAAVDVGHSVRTVDEAIALHGRTLDAWTSMLESRFLVGSRALADGLFAKLLEQGTERKDTWFIEGVFADQRSRHERFGSSVKLLEPNVKKSAGGIRDFHALFWLYRATEPAYCTPIGSEVPASRTFLDQLLKDGRLDAEQHTAALLALGFLFRVRHAMHYARDSQHDTLEYALQRLVAERLGYGEEAELHSVEVFMRDYYRHARMIHRLNLQLGERFREIIEPARSDGRVQEQAGDMFSVGDEVVSVDPGIKRLSTPAQVFEAFVVAAERDVDLDFRLRGAIERSTDLLTEDQARSPELAAMFRRILRSKRVAGTLRAMNDLGVLERYLPEFGRLVAFFQHNVYHYFTADEHTLIAIDKAERLRMERGMLHEVFRVLPRKDLLYLTILLHDIAKPLGVGDHEITGVEVARAVLHRIGMDEAFPDIGFLIRNHLVMEQTAFRRNLHDPGSIREFAARFERPEWLDYLYVLTYADLSAVNTSVWTEWKAAMLQELYQRTSEVLRRNLRGEQVDEFHQAKREAATGRVVDGLSAELPRDVVERHLKAMQSDAYISLFTEQEISLHIRKSAEREGVATIFSHSEGYTEVTFIADDAPFALSKFCAVLAANDANILDANIFTRDDGIIIDRFRVSDSSSKRELEGRVYGKIEEDLKKVMEGTLDIDHLFAEHHRKWKRRPKRPANPNVRTDVEFEDAPSYTIIDVYAPDSVGFLYRVTETISRLGLDIYFAKIATRVDGIVDAFYVLDRSGKPLQDPSLRGSVRQEILATIKRLAEQELM